MSEGLKRLKEIGAQKISEQTHISRNHIQAVIHGSFEGMRKIQFLGFISILEREYGIDLSELRKSGLEYFADEVYSLEKEMFKTPKNPQRTSSVIILLILFIIAVIIYYGYSSQEGSQLGSSTIEKITVNALEENDTQKLESVEVNKTEVLEANVTEDRKTDLVEETLPPAPVLEPIKKEEVAQVKEKTPVKQSFKLVTTQKLWVGYIDAQTHKKYQKVIKGEFSLDPSKDWLLSLGHGNVDVYVNGIKKAFKSPKHLYLVYKNSSFTKVSSKRFRKLNRGRLW